MKIVYFGSDVFLDSFEDLAREHTILALYTYHNDEDYFTEYGIVRRAKELGIPVHYESITEGEIERLFSEEGCELFITAEYDRILPIPPGLDAFCGVNIHSSLLPVGRSYYPIECAMERHLTRMGVSMHVLRSQLDRGELIYQHEFELTDGMDSVDVYLECARAAREMVGKLMQDVRGQLTGARAQEGRLPYWKRPADEAMTLTPDMTCEAAMELFRRYNCMMEAVIDGRCYHVKSIMRGSSALPWDHRWLSDTLCLYRTRDGHLRLTLVPTTRR